MRIKIKLLKHKPDFSTQPGKTCALVMNLGPVHKNFSGDNGLQFTDAPDQRAFSRDPLGPADHGNFSGSYRQVDVIEHMKLSKPFMNMRKLNH